ncbi:MAG TPA: hypothetical protein VFQ53_41425 [Kofleriaceae bacterium]|nr:hypothetical protein [Kofleriaceae bacterium]
MYDIDAIEAINFEQLVTATDRLLLRSRVAHRRLSTHKIVLRTDHPFARGSRPVLEAVQRPTTPPPVRHRTVADQTVIVRPVRRVDRASVAVIATLLTIAASLAAML